MSIAVTSGYYTAGSNADNYKATSKFIPEIWSGKLQVKFYKSTVLGEITNNDWEGEIKNQGDKVIIRSVPNITISDYTKGMNLTNQVPTSTPLELNIDKGKYFSFVLDDVDEVQTDVKLMDMFSNDAAQQMKIVIDTDVLNNVGADAASANKGATAGAITGNINLGAVGAPLAITKDGASSTVSILDTILDLGLVLDEQNVPEDGRWMVVPAWVAALLKRSELRQAQITGDDITPLRNGKVGMIDRFTLYVSNSLTSFTDLGSDAAAGGAGAAADTTAYNLLAGTRDAISFASQITSVETLRSTTTFGDIMRGLNVYGYKVVKPEALAVARVRKG